MAELKLKMSPDAFTFSISALLLEVTLKMLVTLFTFMDPLSKNAPQIFERHSSCKNIEQNVKASFMYSTEKVK